jgi:hypothetical protein
VYLAPEHPRRQIVIAVSGGGLSAIAAVIAMSRTAPRLARLESDR